VPQIFRIGGGEKEHKEAQCFCFVIMALFPRVCPPTGVVRKEEEINEYHDCMHNERKFSMFSFFSSHGSQMM
jgi:hypothetical protein